MKPREDNKNEKISVEKKKKIKEDLNLMIDIVLCEILIVAIFFVIEVNNVQYFIVVVRFIHRWYANK